MTTAPLRPTPPAPATHDAASPVPSRRVLTDLAAEAAPHLGTVSADHGFLPTQPPAASLPASHRAWDDLAAQLPELWRAVAVRRALADLPELSAEPGDLPDGDLWRASVVLSALAYSWARCDLGDLHAAPPFDLPPAVLRPWQRVAERMGRPGPHLAYDDLVTHNWRLIEPDADDPVRLENLHLLVPLLGNDTERAFLGVNIEIQARLAPVVAASVAAQEAAVAGDRDALVASLLVVLDAVRAATDVAFGKIDPNPYAPIHADPVLWAKLTAPTGIPVVAGSPGVSGAGSTGFQLVDALLGRTRFASPLGGEGLKVRSWYAPNVGRFLDAVDQTSVRAHVAASGDGELSGLFQSVLSAYAGERGYLGVHRRKVYGFISMAFKVGRPATASGISGTFQDRTWRQTDHELGEARDERYQEFFSHAQTGRVAAREPAGDGAQRVTLDVAGTGLRFRPGDRCAVLPAQTDEQVTRTLAALRGTADREVPITRAWRTALHERWGTEAPATLPLGDLLRRAELRPLTRPVVKALHRLSGSAALHDVLEARTEDSLEVWDALELATAAGYDVTRLWRAELWQDEAIARLLRPAVPRMYSVSALPDADPFPDALQLTVGSLRFDGDGPDGEPVERAGAAATWLTEAAPLGTELPLEVVRPLRFTLPADARRPVVMFAGGTGVAPFRGFAAARAADPAAGPTWLFVGARTPEDLPYLAELTDQAVSGRLELRTAYSRVEVDGVPARRVGEAIREPGTAEQLRSMLKAAGSDDDGPLFYVCGQAAFAATVLDALRDLVGGEEGREAVRRLVGRGGLMTDLFTTRAPRSAPGLAGDLVVDASDLVLHNDAEHGWWMAVNGLVYDMTEFRLLHPGGHRIIDDNAGVDATSEYLAVLHHQDSEIEAMLAMYKIGRLRRLDLGTAWGVALHAGALHHVTVADLVRAWLRATYLVVELQNSLGNDMGVLDAALTPGDDELALNPLKLMLAADLQTRVTSVYLPALTGSLEELWAMACGLLAPAEAADGLARRLREARDGEPGSRSAAAVAALRAAVAGGDLDAAGCSPLVAELRAADLALAAGVKAALREGLLHLEEHEGRLLDAGSRALLTYLDAVPEAVLAYHRRVTAAVDAHLLPALT